MSTWMRNFRMSIENKEAIILYGNVRDKYINADNNQVYSNLTDLIQNMANEHSLHFTRQIFYDFLGKERSSVTSKPKPAENPGDELNSTAPPPVAASRAEPPTILARWNKDLSATRENTLATIFYLDKLISYKQSAYSPEERDVLLLLEKILENISPNNRLIMVALQDSLVPIELYTNSPKVTLIPISLPDKQDRALYLKHRLKNEQINIDLVSNLTDGLYLKDLDNIVKTLEVNTGIGTREIKEIINKYRIGEQQDYWGNLDIEKLNTAFRWFTEEEGVRGQDEAVKRVVEVLTLARAGLTGIASGTLSKPKGVLFFAGPTGVGKTMIAKKLAKFLFSSEEAFIRFDMSEFKEEHTVSKLIGSPPGYVGYEKGGLLTGAVREKPFSVVLFDEIEKAHPKIMDIFLQILDEGRLTDSRGQTVFFSETVIVFTSNIGTRTQDGSGRSIAEKERDKIDHILKDRSLTPEIRSEKIHQHFSGTVSDFFMFEISRPELLNRIGDNIIPFNYIDNSEMQRQIIQSHLSRIKRDFEEKFRNSGFKLEISELVADYFISKYNMVISNFGGRAITNAIENELMKPLSRGLLRAEFNGSKNITFKIALENNKVIINS